MSDLNVPEGVTVLTDPEEPLARVQPPRVEEEIYPEVEGEELEEGEEAVEGEEAPEGEAAAEGGESAEDAG